MSRKKAKVCGKNTRGNSNMYKYPREALLDIMNWMGRDNIKAKGVMVET